MVTVYGGRKLIPVEKNYSLAEREALALISGIQHFRSYLYGIHFKVFTDYSVVCWLMQLKEPNRWLARRALLLQQYDCEIKGSYLLPTIAVTCNQTSLSFIQ